MKKKQLATILVEDSPTIRETLVPALEDLAGAIVVGWAASSKDARTVLDEWHGRWNLLVVDLFLASGSGLDVLAAVRDRDLDQHVLVLSNYATQEMRRRCFELGANGVFDKSTEIDGFIERCLEIAVTR